MENMPNPMAICYYLALLIQICSLFPSTIMTLKKGQEEKKSISMEYFKDLSLDLFLIHGQGRLENRS